MHMYREDSFQKPEQTMNACQTIVFASAGPFLMERVFVVDGGGGGSTGVVFYELGGGGGGGFFGGGWGGGGGGGGGFARDCVLRTMSCVWLGN